MTARYKDGHCDCVLIVVVPLYALAIQARDAVLPDPSLPTELSRAPTTSRRMHAAVQPGVLHGSPGRADRASEWEG